LAPHDEATTARGDARPTKLWAAYDVALEPSLGIYNGHPLQIGRADGAGQSIHLKLSCFDQIRAVLSQIVSLQPVPQILACHKIVL